MSRIKGCFEALSNQGRRALIPYLVAGDPHPQLTVPLMHSLVGAGADIIELGVPFSDPMAEGPAIQLGHERALAKGVSLKSVLDMVREFRIQDQQTPVLLMGYANPIVRMGYEAFLATASEHGLDAVLTVDMPPEEVGSFNQGLQRAGMDNILLIAPTTGTDRIDKIVQQASGFLYCVSLKGVTGSGNLDVEQVKGRVAEIRARSSLPIAVGFGIKDAESAAAIGRVADGVVVGSALVQLMADASAAGKSQQQVSDNAVSLVTAMRAALDAS